MSYVVLEFSLPANHQCQLRMFHHNAEVLTLRMFHHKAEVLTLRMFHHKAEVLTHTSQATTVHADLDYCELELGLQAS